MNPDDAVFFRDAQFFAGEGGRKSFFQTLENFFFNLFADFLRNFPECGQMNFNDIAGAVF